MRISFSARILLLLTICLMFLIVRMQIVAQDFNATLFVDRDSITLYIPDNGVVSIEGLGFVVALPGNSEARFYWSDYSSFTVLTRTLITPVCLRLERSNEIESVPIECQQDNVRLVTQKLESEDVFW